MRRREVIASGLSAFLAGPALAGVKVDQPAPAFEVKTLSGETLSSRGLAGKVVILSFWATWCAPCRLEMPTLDTYYKTHKADGLEIVAISMDDPSQDKVVRQVMSNFSFPSALQRDAKIKGYGRIWSLPMAFVIDRQGVLRKDGSQKASVFDTQSLEALVTPLLRATR